MLFYAVFFLGVVFVGLAWCNDRLARWLLPDWQVEWGWFRGLGVLLFAAGLACYTYCSYLLSSRGEGAFVEFDAPARLVRVGPYRWVRNPIVVCVIVMLAGEAIACSSIGIAAMIPIGLGLAYLQNRLEERLLRQRFGAEYERYCAETPRWIPRRPSSLTAREPLPRRPSSRP